MPGLYGNQSGVGLIFVVLILLVVGIISAVFVSLINTETFTAMKQSRGLQVIGIAEGGMERALYQFKTGTSCAGLNNTTALGAGSFTVVGTPYRPANTAINQVGGITNSATTITVDSTAGYAPRGRIRIDAELIDYTGTTATSFTGVRRGMGGTTAAVHADNAVVAQNQCFIRSTGTVAGPVGTLVGSPLATDQRIIEASVVNSPFVQSGTQRIQGIGNPITLDIPLATPVDPARTFLIFNTRHNSARPVGGELRGQILNANTVRFQQTTDANQPIDIRWYVVEYFSGVNVQRGSVQQTATTINVVPPQFTAVANLNQAFVTWSKTPVNDHTTWDDNDPILGELTTTTNLQFRVTAADAGQTIWWQVVEFTNPADIFVQKGTIVANAMPAGTATRTAALATAVNVNRTFVLAGFRTTGAGNDVGARTMRAELTNGTTLTFTRSLTTDTINEITWQAIELRDGSTVQRGTENFPNGDAQELVNLNPAVDVTRSIAFASVQPTAGQSLGSTPYNGNDIPGVTSATMALTPAVGPATQITMDRNNTASSADIAWFVVEFDRKPRFEWAEFFP